MKEVRTEVKVKRECRNTRTFLKMNVCKITMAVAVSIFKITDSLPRKEDYGLTSQIRRSSLSISANIEEAIGRKTSADKRKFYDYARGSAYETMSHLLYGKELGYFEERMSLK